METSLPLRCQSTKRPTRTSTSQWMLSPCQIEAGVSRREYCPAGSCILRATRCTSSAWRVSAARIVCICRLDISLCTVRRDPTVFPFPDTLIPTPTKSCGTAFCRVTVLGSSPKAQISYRPSVALRQCSPRNWTTNTLRVSGGSR